MISLNQYKAIAGRICDNLTNPNNNHSAYFVAELEILRHRKTKGARAALITGFVVGALCERGRPDLAEQVLLEIAKIASERKGF